MMPVGKNTLDLTNSASGIYFIEVVTSTQKSTVKLVKN
jgi:hypothetical protein